MQRNEQQDECFIDHQNIIQIRQTNDTLEIPLKNLLKQQPANQLISVRRPTTMIPRTLFTEILFSHLPQVLQQPGSNYKVTLNLSNKKQLTLIQYFQQEKFICIYKKYPNKVGFPQIFIERMKCIQSLSDYNWKMFKQLTQHIINKKQGKAQLDSNFESGNMCRAYINKQKPNSYYLFLENDTNTHGYNNWFFFRIRNVSTGIKKFHIMNIVKKTSMYKQGMMISIFSMNKYIKDQIGWFKGGMGINFTQTQFERINHIKQYYHCLSFQYDFKQENDQVYFAMNKPYTYTRLIRFINSNWSNKLVVKVNKAGYTLSNNIIPALTLGVGENIHLRKCIIFLARQHPSETMGSYVMESLMKVFAENDQIADYLLTNYQILLIPMVNPDGVIHGNSRCNLAGFDLNRQWGQNILKDFTPETFKLKELLVEVNKNCGIELMVDLHGHGKRFLFSCQNENNITKIMSLLMGKIQPRFNLQSCTFGVSKDKQNTVRNLIYKFGNYHSYTLQNSFYGYSDKLQIKHYIEEDFYKIAKSLVQSIFILFSNTQNAFKMFGFNKQTIYADMKSTLDNIQKQQNQKNQKQMESESDPDGDGLNIEERINVLINPLKTISKKMRQTCIEIKKITTKKPRLKTNSVKKLTYTPQVSNQQAQLKFQQVQKLQTQGQQILKNKQIDLKKKKPAPHIYIQQKKNKMRQRTALKFSVNEPSAATQALQKTTKYVEVQKKQSIQIKHQVKQQLNGNFGKARICNSVIHQYANQKNDWIKRKITQKVKTQVDITQKQFFKQKSCNQSQKKQILNKIQANKKFKSLKQQSEKFLVNDSLSILKLQRKIFKQQKNKCHIRSQTKYQDSIRNFVNQKTKMQKQSRKNKYKRFQDFKTNDYQLRKRSDYSSNSVFYYFPIL